MKRLFDFFLALLTLVFLLAPFAIIAILIKMTSKGPIIYWSRRYGKNNEIFLMPKFRTMKDGAPQLPAHLIDDHDKYTTSFGRFMRKYSLDELPQIWSILVGHMSFVGPRPVLFNHKDIIELRTLEGVHSLKPGLTGWAQINGRDAIEAAQKVNCDKWYMINRSFFVDMKIIFYTFFKVIAAKDVSR